MYDYAVVLYAAVLRCNYNAGLDGAGQGEGDHNIM